MMSELMHKYKEKTINASKNIFRSEDIINKEKSILDNLNIVESYFTQQLIIFKNKFPSFLIKFEESSTYNNTYINFLFNSNGYSFYSSDYGFDFCIKPNSDFSFTKELKQSFKNEEQYKIIKEGEALFLALNMDIVKLFYDTLTQIKKYCEETDLIFKNDFENKVNFIQNFFVKEHPLKEMRKRNIKSDFSGFYLSFNKKENRVTISNYNFKYNNHKGQLESKNYKVTYKEAKSYVDKNIVFNDQLIIYKSQLQELLPVFQLTEIERKQYKGYSYKENIYCCDIDILFEFVNAAGF